MITIGRILKVGLSQLAKLNRFVQPVNLTINEAAQIPKLKLKSQKHLLQNWWSEAPFELAPNAPLSVPIFSFHSSKFLNKQIDLPQDIFNYPLRRDLIYRLYDYRIKLDKFTTKKTRNRAETHGSGRKVRKQKGMGAARMGSKRAPHLYKGGKAHGAKPKVYSYPLNAKIKLNALKALFSAKMAQGKIKIVDTEAIQEGKTKYVSQAFERHLTDERAIMCVITGSNVDENFQRAQRNMRRVLWHDSYSLDVLSLFKADRILITKQGLEELIENIYKTTYVVYRHPSMPQLQQKTEQKQKQQTFDPSQPYEFKFKILAQYMERYQELKKTMPDLIEREQFKTRKIDTLL